MLERERPLSRLSNYQLGDGREARLPASAEGPRELEETVLWLLVLGGLR